MKRRAQIALMLGGAACGWASLGRAQDGVRRIGVLSPSRVDDPAAYPEPLVQGLRERGWVEGRNLVIERRVMMDRPDLLPAAAAELVALKVEVIVTVGTPAALAARRASASVAIVTATIADPVDAGLAQSLARPGGNVTGNTFIEPGLGMKRLELLLALAPRAQRIGEMVNMDNPAMNLLRAGETDAMRRLGREPVWVDVRSADALEAAFDELARQRAQALVVHSDALLVSHRRRICELALRQRLPTVAEGRRFVEAGALASYAANTDAMVRNAASFVDKILRGTPPAELPFERPTRFELLINGATARALGLAIPPALRVRADEVIE